jgi:hypothetical protein
MSVSLWPRPAELAGVVLDAFTGHRLVGIGELHGLQDHHDALQLLLADPRLVPCQNLHMSAEVVFLAVISLLCGTR